MNKGRFVAGVLGLALLLGAAGFGGTAVAQLNAFGRPNFGVMTLRPGFMPDPRSRPVVSGGNMPAQSLAGPSCRGYITPQPDVVLNLLGTSPWSSAV